MRMLLILVMAFLAGMIAHESLASCPTPMCPGVMFRDCPTCPIMIEIPAGSFLMGQDKGASSWEGSSELPQHKVTIAYNFAIGIYPVTQAEWQAVMGSNPSYFQGPNYPNSATRPVETVSWNDIQTFITQLNTKTKKTYRLPSEAEWEYVARAETQTPYFFSSRTTKPSGDWTLLDSYAWYNYNPNTNGKTHPVGQLLPNKFKVYDIYGNVWQWVQDCYHYNYRGAPSNGSAWTTSGCSARVLRGGSWLFIPIRARSAFRFYYTPALRNNNFGFRLARTLPR